MARTLGTIRHPKYCNIWPSNRIQAQKARRISYQDHLKKILKYYPKTLQSVKSITLSFHKLDYGRSYGTPVEYADKKRLIKRYKRDLIHYFEINISSKSRFWEGSINNLQTLAIYQEGTSVKASHRYLKHCLLRNKKLKSIELSARDPKTAQSLMNLLKYSNSLKDISLDYIPFLSLNLWKSLLIKSCSHVESLTMEGVLDPKYSKDKLESFAQLLSMVFEMHYLKKFQFDVKIPEGFDINRIPFDRLNSKQISYDIRVCHPKPSFKLQNLESLDFLAINNIMRIDGFDYIWQDFIEDHLTCQQNTRKLLFLNLNPEVKYNLSPLLQACKNIIVLDLSLKEMENDIIDSICLQELQSLKHFFLSLHNSGSYFDKLLMKLTQGLQDKKLSTLALEFKHINFLESSVFLSFLNMCASTVNKVLLNFTHGQGGEQRITDFYESIRNMKCLKHLTIRTCPKVFIEKRDHHFASLAKVLLESHGLEELHLTFPSMLPQFVNFDMTCLKNLKNLKKLSLYFGEKIITVQEFKVVQFLTKLNYIQFPLFGSSDINNEDQQIFFQILKNNRELEIIKIKYVNMIELENRRAIKQYSEKLVNEKSKLKMILLEDIDEDEVTIIKSTCFQGDVHDVVSKDYSYNPPIYCNKIPLY